MAKHIDNIFKIGIISMVPIFSVSDLMAGEVINFSGNDRQAISVTPEKSSGLDNIFVLYNTQGVTLSFQSKSDNVKWMKFSNLGGAYAEEIADISVSGNVYSLNSPQGNMGYIIYDDDISYTFWIVDYSAHTFNINSITIPSEQSCDMTEIIISGNAEPIYYFTINGKRETLDRDILIEYNTLSWNEENMQFQNESIQKSVASLSTNITLTPPPYCNTYFRISGDKFLQSWDMEQIIESELFVTNAVSVNSVAQQTDNSTEDNSNQLNSDVDGLGGSAPCEITFSAYVTDAVIHNEWQMATDMEFENITHRINQQDFTYSFTEEGETYVRFVGSNSDGSCESFGDVYTVSIGSSELLIPNAFSPNGDGINDIWKVAYRSLIDFECWIFDRQGHQMFYFNNPANGWDGSYKGKTVKSGVYYYVIQAVGSDGKKYKKSGDINILHYKNNSSSSYPDE